MAEFLTLDNVYSLYQINPHQKSKGIFIIDQTEDPIKDYLNCERQFDGLLLAFMLKGSMKARIHFLEYNINEGDIVIVLPQLMIEALSASENAEIISIGISLDFISVYPSLIEFITNNHIRWNPIVHLKEEEQKLHKEFFLLLQKFYHKPPSSHKNETFQHLIMALINMLREAYPILTNENNLYKSRLHEIIDDFYILISKYANEQRNVRFYAEKMNITPQYLSTLLKNKTGKSVLQWIDYVVIMNAKSLLKSSNLSVKEISNLLHFNDASLFCRYFKRNTGVSPKKFRNIPA